MTCETLIDELARHKDREVVVWVAQPDGSRPGFAVRLVGMDDNGAIVLILEDDGRSI